MVSSDRLNPELRADLRVDVLGVGVSVIDLPTAVDTIRRWIRNGAREYVCVTGVHGVMESQRDPELREIHNRAGMVTPDGMPMVWCGHHAGAAPMSRVYGPDLMLAVCAEAADEGWKMFFYGGRDGIADLLASRLLERFPGLSVVGTLSPPFRALSEAEEVRTVETIDASGADIVWVGLSTPKQERWMDRLRPQLRAPVLLGVGAAFDIHAGVLPQAPVWMQRHGLEWAYRLAREPRRLASRYLVNNPRFLYQIVRNSPRLRPQ